MEEGSVRERLLEAAFTCVGRYGIAKTTMEDVARTAGMSRATVYRYFPGGKEQVVGDVITWEVGRFFERLGRAVQGATGLAGLVEEALLFAHRAVVEHEVLQKVLQTEPDRLLPHLVTENDRLLGMLKVFLVPALRGVELPEGVAPDVAADHVARMLVSFIGSPGRWDLTDREQVRRLVRTQVLAGITDPATR